MVRKTEGKKKNSTRDRKRGKECWGKKYHNCLAKNVSTVANVKRVPV